MVWLTVTVTIFLWTQWVLAQRSRVTCSPSFDWAKNDQGQDPCEVAAQLQASCHGNTDITIPSLAPNEIYLGPDGRNTSDGCACNSVVYSLLSVCAACQDRFFIDWPSWTKHCTMAYLSTYPSPISSEITVPSWAFSAISAPCNRFDVKYANEMAVSNKIGIPQTDSSSRTPIIVGAVIGSSVGAIAIILGTIFLVRKRRRSAIRGDGGFKGLLRIKVPRHGSSLWSGQAPSFSYSPLDMDAVNRARGERHSPAVSKISLPSQLHHVSPDAELYSPAVASSELFSAVGHSEKSIHGSATSAHARRHSLRRAALSRGSTFLGELQPSPSEEDFANVRGAVENNTDSVR